MKPLIYVQGKLFMSSTSLVSPDNMVSNIVLPGTTETITSFMPLPDNSMIYKYGTWNFGKKLFVVAGWEIQILGLPWGCTSWVSLHDINPEGPVT